MTFGPRDVLRIMEETVDGEYQNFKANDGAFVRKHFSESIRNCLKWCRG